VIVRCEAGARNSSGGLLDKSQAETMRWSLTPAVHSLFFAQAVADFFYRKVRKGRKGRSGQSRKDQCRKDQRRKDCNKAETAPKNQRLHLR
jgi:hypothetical protein